MKHLTLTGYYAGHPFCDVDKEKAKLNGDTFIHYGYIRSNDMSGRIASDEEILSRDDICPECKKELQRVLNE